MDFIISTKWDGKPRTLYRVVCHQCTTNFYAPMCRINKGEAKYCSRKCAFNSRRTKLEVTCIFCGTRFKRKPSTIKKSKSGFLFCSRSCKDNGQKITNGMKEIWPTHYGDGSFVNYRKIAFALLPRRCNRCGYAEHTDIMRVHHRDRNRTNNDISNLEILCPNCHETEHFIAGDGMYTPRKMVDRADNDSA